jgi:hypothetical protein
MGKRGIRQNIRRMFKRLLKDLGEREATKQKLCRVAI